MAFSFVASKSSNEQVINMKIRYAILALSLIPVMIISGQEPGLISQIIVKLKKENGFNSLSPKGVLLTGSSRVDSLTGLFDAVRVVKNPAGRGTGKYFYTVSFPEGANIGKIIESYLKTCEIEYAEPDFTGTGGGVQEVTPDDQYYFRQWGLKNNGTFANSPAVAGADVEMEKAWAIQKGDTAIIAAIMDSGTKLDHPEFAGRLWKNHGETVGNGIDDDNNGYIDDTKGGWDFVNSDNNPSDDHGHGTNVSGILGATGNNGIGYAGIDWNCKLMILKGLDSQNNGLYSKWASAIYYATDNGARVINISAGGLSYSTTLWNAVSYAIDRKVSVVACMMNTNSGTLYYPAAMTGVIAVGSTDANDKRSNPFFWSPTSGSNYGNHISVVAPGNYIYGLDYQSVTEYGYYWGGTSQATPLVSGLVSLLLAQDSTRTPAQIKQIIERGAEDQVGDPSEDTMGWDKYYGYGRVNAYNALAGINSDAEKNIGETEITVYPNPTSGKFTVLFPPASEKIRISNSLGQVIIEKEVTGVSFSEFLLKDNGFYFVSIITDREILTKRIIVLK